MNVHRVLLASAALAASLAGAAAHAQDASASDDWRARTYNGIYVSGAAGIASGANGKANSIVFDRDNNGTYGDTLVNAAGNNVIAGFCKGYNLSTTPGDCKTDRNKPDYAVRIGWDTRLGNWVAGGLVEGFTNDTRDATSAFATTGNAYRIARGIDYGVAVRGRVGYTPGGGGLFYATGGVGYARMKHVFRTTNTANTFTENNADKWRWGWQAGGGAEVMVTPRMSIGMEYLYNRYRDRDYSVAVTQGSAPATSPFVLAGGQTNMRVNTPDYSYNTIRGTVSFHF